LPQCDDAWNMFIYGQKAIDIRDLRERHIKRIFISKSSSNSPHLPHRQGLLFIKMPNIPLLSPVVRSKFQVQDEIQVLRDDARIGGHSRRQKEWPHVFQTFHPRPLSTEEQHFELPFALGWMQGASSYSQSSAIELSKSRDPRPKLRMHLTEHSGQNLTKSNYYVQSNLRNFTFWTFFSRGN
jgi:hypothetical protein